MEGVRRWATGLSALAILIFHHLPFLQSSTSIVYSSRTRHPCTNMSFGSGWCIGSGWTAALSLSLFLKSVSSLMTSGADKQRAAAAGAASSDAATEKEVRGNGYVFAHRKCSCVPHTRAAVLKLITLSCTAVNCRSL